MWREKASGLGVDCTWGQGRSTVAARHVAWTCRGPEFERYRPRGPSSCGSPQEEADAGGQETFSQHPTPDASSLANTPFAPLAATPLGTCSRCFRVRSGTVLPGSPETEPGRASPGARGRRGAGRVAVGRALKSRVPRWPGGRAPVAPGARGQNMPSQKPGRGWRGQRRPL